MPWPIVIEHYELPEGHWWHCQFPERPPEPLKSHYKRRCRACLIAFMASAHNQPPTKQSFYLGDKRVAHYGNAELLTEWWFIATEEEMDAYQARPDVVAAKQKSHSK